MRGITPRRRGVSSRLTNTPGSIRTTTGTSRYVLVRAAGHNAQPWDSDPSRVSPPWRGCSSCDLLFEEVSMAAARLAKPAMVRDACPTRSRIRISIRIHMIRAWRKHSHPHPHWHIHMGISQHGQSRIHIRIFQPCVTVIFVFAVPESRFRTRTTQSRLKYLEVPPATSRFVDESIEHAGILSRKTVVAAGQGSAVAGQASG